MALPTFVAAGTQGAGTGAVAPGIPAGSQADDILVLGVDSNSSQPAAAPTGYTQFPDSPQDVGGLGSACLSVFWKRHSGSESAPTVADTGNHTNAVIIAIRGCVTTGDPFDVTAGDVTAGGAGSTVVTIPGDTTTVADCLILALATHSTDTLTAQFSAWANTDLSDVTERVDASTDAGGGGGLGIATGGKATAGAYGATTATLATSSEQGRMSIALKAPAAGGATLTPAMLTHARTVFAPDLDTTVLPALQIHSRAIHAPQVNPTIAPALLTHARTVFSPAVVAAGALLLPDRITHTRTVYDPKVNPSVLPGLVTHTRTVFDPTVGPTLKPPLLTHARNVFAPNVVHVITPPIVTHTRQTFDPQLNVAVTLPMLTHARAVYEPAFPGIPGVGASHTHSIHPHRHRDGDEF